MKAEIKCNFRNLSYAKSGMANFRAITLLLAICVLMLVSASNSAFAQKTQHKDWVSECYSTSCSAIAQASTFRGKSLDNKFPFTLNFNSKFWGNKVVIFTPHEFNLRPNFPLSITIDNDKPAFVNARFRRNNADPQNEVEFDLKNVKYADGRPYNLVSAFRKGRKATIVLDHFMMDNFTLDFSLMGFSTAYGQANRVNQIILAEEAQPEPEEQTANAFKPQFKKALKQQNKCAKISSEVRQFVCNDAELNALEEQVVAYISKNLDTDPDYGAADIINDFYEGQGYACGSPSNPVANIPKYKGMRFRDCLLKLHRDELVNYQSIVASKSSGNAWGRVCNGLPCYIATNFGEYQLQWHDSDFLSDEEGLVITSKNPISFYKNIANVANIFLDGKNIFGEFIDIGSNRWRFKNAESISKEELLRHLGDGGYGSIYSFSSPSLKSTKFSLYGFNDAYNFAHKVTRELEGEITAEQVAEAEATQRQRYKIELLSDEVQTYKTCIISERDCDADAVYYEAVGLGFALGYLHRGDYSKHIELIPPYFMTLNQCEKKSDAEISGCQKTLISKNINYIVNRLGLSKSKLDEYVSWFMKPKPTPQELNDKIVAAIESGDVVALKSLINDGLDPNSFLEGKASLLYVSILLGKFEIVKALLESGANPNATANIKGYSTNMGISRRIYKTNKNMMHLMLEYGGDPFINGIMIEAVHYGDIEFLKKTVSKGYDVKNYRSVDEPLILIMRNVRSQEYLHKNKLYPDDYDFSRHCSWAAQTENIRPYFCRNLE